MSSFAYNNVHTTTYPLVPAQKRMHRRPLFSAIAAAHRHILLVAHETHKARRLAGSVEEATGAQGFHVGAYGTVVAVLILLAKHQVLSEMKET